MNDFIYVFELLGPEEDYGDEEEVVEVGVGLDTRHDEEGDGDDIKVRLCLHIMPHNLPPVTTHPALTIHIEPLIQTHNYITNQKPKHAPVEYREAPVDKLSLDKVLTESHY